VGVSLIEDDGLDFHNRLIELNEDFSTLNNEAEILAKTIINNLKNIL
jgi:hypothetical protein